MEEGPFLSYSPHSLSLPVFMHRRTAKAQSEEEERRPNLFFLFMGSECVRDRKKEKGNESDSRSVPFIPSLSEAIPPVRKKRGNSPEIGDHSLG